MNASRVEVVLTSLYCIPGLGASPAIFSRLKLNHAEIRAVKCPTPQAQESIAKYASLLATQIDWSRPPILLGHSFGGILAIEIAAQRPVGKLILVSSVKHRRELPWYGRAIGSLRLHRLAPLSLQERSLKLSEYLNGIETEDELDMLRSMLAERDIGLLKWSIEQVLTWRGQDIPQDVVQIHGTADRLIPARFVKPDIWVEGGTHFMIVSRAPEISRLLDQIVLAV
ncbi:MAG: alpha/beta fold hydrolase [Candidatus Zixiibacteriota bacterium]